MAAAVLDLHGQGVRQTSGRGRAPRPEANPAGRRRTSWRVRRRAVVLAATLSAMVAAGTAAAATRPAPPPGPSTSVVVAPGDTLWGLAQRHAPPGTDRHAWAARVLTDNGVDARALAPGSVLVVPGVD